MFTRYFISAVLMICSVGATMTFGQGVPQRVQFKRGTHSCTVTGRVKGDAYQDFIMRARAGETMILKLNPDNPATNLVLHSVNGKPTKNAETQEWTGILPENGEYVVRVFMTRAETRRQESISNFSLYVFITLLPTAKLLPDFVYFPTRKAVRRQFLDENPS
ncbi:MAG: hypothetical protein ABIP75_20120 [Pyrinomonadaceae bacterium]